MAFRFFYGVGERGTTPYSARINRAETPFARRAIVLYQSDLGNYPRDGLHTIAGDFDAYLVEHRHQCFLDTHERIPNRFDGPVVIDYEAWHPLWAWLDRDLKAEWARTFAARNTDVLVHLSPVELEAIASEEYERMAARFLVETVRACKRARRSANFGIYGLPAPLFRSSLSGQNAIGYDDMASAANAGLERIIDVCDIVLPVIYPFRRVADVPADNREYTDAVDKQFVASNVAEAVRLARGKPVYPLTMPFYRGPEWRDATLDERIVNGATTANQIRESKKAGASGLILWADLSSDEETALVQGYFNSTMGPESIRAARGM